MPRLDNGHCHGSTAFGVVAFCGGAAGGASRHAAVICCGDGFTVRPAVVERYTRIMSAGVYPFGNFDTSYIVFRVQGVIPARTSV